MQQDKEFLRKAPIGKLLFQLALPAIAAQINGDAFGADRSVDEYRTGSGIYIRIRDGRARRGAGYSHFAGIVHDMGAVLFAGEKDAVKDTAQKYEIERQDTASVRCAGDISVCDAGERKRYHGVL